MRLGSTDPIRLPAACLPLLNHRPFEPHVDVISRLLSRLLGSLFTECTITLEMRHLVLQLIDLVTPTSLLNPTTATLLGWTTERLAWRSRTGICQAHPGPNRRRRRRSSVVRRPSSDVRRPSSVVVAVVVVVVVVVAWERDQILGPGCAWRRSTQNSTPPRAPVREHACCERISWRPPDAGPPPAPISR